MRNGLLKGALPDTLNNFETPCRTACCLLPLLITFHPIFAQECGVSINAAPRVLHELYGYLYVFACKAVLRLNRDSKGIKLEAHPLKLDRRALPSPHMVIKLVQTTVSWGEIASLRHQSSLDPRIEPPEFCAKLWFHASRPVPYEKYGTFSHELRTFTDRQGGQKCVI